jgi:hypothetical protein
MTMMIYTRKMDSQKGCLKRFRFSNAPRKIPEPNKPSIKWTSYLHASIQFCFTQPQTPTIVQLPVIDFYSTVNAVSC